MGEPLLQWDTLVAELKRTGPKINGRRRLTLDDVLVWSQLCKRKYVNPGLDLVSYKLSEPGDSPTRLVEVRLSYRRGSETYGLAFAESRIHRLPQTVPPRGILIRLIGQPTSAQIAALILDDAEYMVVGGVGDPENTLCILRRCLISQLVYTCCLVNPRHNGPLYGAEPSSLPT